MAFYASLFARVYDPFMQRFEQSFLGAMRAQMLGHLEGRILEVGAGTGVNFGYYSAGAQVLACEPAEDMLRRAEEKLQQAVVADIELVHAGVGDEALDDRIAPHSLDAIVCTLVLCTVPDPQAAFEAFRRWLKPGGQLLILEHVQPLEGQWRRQVFQFIQPVWGCVAEGCQLNRPTGQWLREAGFAPVWERRFERGLPFLQGVYELG